jgi:hypothetical protein
MGADHQEGWSLRRLIDRSIQVTTVVHDGEVLMYLAI